jgi:ubiquinone biosynthesis protein UbiJ
MSRRHGAAGVLAAVEAAAEDLQGARKSWARYLQEQQTNPESQVPAEAEEITAEIALLDRRAAALDERLAEARSGR